MSYSIIPKNVSVDNVTIDKNNNGEIEIKGGAVNSDLLNTKIKNQINNMVYNDSFNAGAVIDLSSYDYDYYTFELTTESGEYSTHKVYCQINDDTSQNYQYIEVGQQQTTNQSDNYTATYFQIGYSYKCFSRGIIKIVNNNIIFESEEFNRGSTKVARYCLLNVNYTKINKLTSYSSTNTTTANIKVFGHYNFNYIN